MGRPAKQSTRGNARRRAAPSLRKTPTPTFGDVVTMLQPETWAHHGRAALLMCVQAALFAALAACARIGHADAGRLLLDEALTGTVVLKTSRGRKRPVHLLPVVMELIMRCAGLRPDDAGPWLFVTSKGKKLHPQTFNRLFRSLGRRHGFRGIGLPERLFEFYDSFFEVEEERAAVAALRRRHSRARERDLSQRAIEAAALDEELLQRVLTRCHPLEGPPGRWLGARGVAAATKTMRLFTSARGDRVGTSQALRSDPICVMLADLGWERGGQVGMRNGLADQHFAHTEALRRAGRLSTADQRFLFHASLRWVRYRQAAAATAQASSSERSEMDRWIAGLPARFLARPRGETVDAFWKRVRTQAPLPGNLARVNVAGVLHRAGALGPRPRKPKTAANSSSFSALLC